MRNAILFNIKERRKAIRSALFAVANKELVLERGHKFKELPTIVESKIETLSKTKEIVATYQPGKTSLSNIAKSRKYFERVYESTIFDIAKQNNISLSKEEIKEKFKIKTRYVVGMVASFSATKDYQSYISLSIQICYKRNDVTFICVGSGDDSFYKRQIPEIHKNRILFLGRQTKVESIMNVCDIGILSTFAEGISNTLLEFMALGKPVVATGEGGTKEFIQNDINGIHIPPKQPKLLAEKIEMLLDNPDYVSKLGRNAKKTITEKFEINKMIKAFFKEYRKLCQV